MSRAPARLTRVVAVGGVAVVAIGALVLAGRSPSTAGAAQPTPSTATAAIERRTLNATTSVDGTLGYDETYAVSNSLATRGTADATTLAQAYASARAQYDSAVAARDALRHPKAADLANARAQLAQVAAALATAEEAAHGATPHDIDQAQAQLAATEAQLVQAQGAAKGPSAAQLAQAQAQVSQAQAQLVAAQRAAAGPTSAQLAQAQAAVTQAQSALTSDQAALAAAEARLATCESGGTNVTPGASASPAPSQASCDLDSLQLEIQQGQARVTTDQAQLSSAQAALSDLASPGSQSQAQANLASAQAAVTSAQANLDALTSAEGQAQAQSNLTAAEAAVAAARSALDSIVAGNPAQTAAQLAAARAQVNAARTALHALGHPTDAQLRQAGDAVATARAQLDAATAALDAPRGVVTDLPALGSIVHPGQTLYTLDGTHPVVLMAGDIPEWRTLEPGIAAGPDIGALEANLRDLGFGGPKLAIDDEWDAETTAAVTRWQHSLGTAESGVVQLGAVVFEPDALRVTKQNAAIGATVQAGTPVLEASSTRRVVSVALDPALQGKVTKGDAVSVMLPDGSTATGSVSDVGTVATAAAGSNPNESATPTIDVSITLDDESATGSLDQAPVTVNITTATATDVLAVPVGALVQTLDSGYAVQVQADGLFRYIPVKLGIFADGWVEVSGAGLAEGQTVVVAK